MIKNILLLIVIVSGQFSLVNAQERIPDREKFSWKDFQDNSIVIKDSIDYDLLQGNWISYQGSHIGDYEVHWKTDDKPKTLQIKGDKYRKTLSGDFYPFIIEKNLIVFECEDNQIDSAYLNLITDKELMISFKRGIDFDQYQYKK
ncbi:MAG: hypothetical protein JXC36_04770 [Candidatus Atribacteria bacterium]|nr:hypothetical protein [Candidatus Atribacteria bacterium]